MTEEHAAPARPSSFSLLNEPWIAARMSDGTSAELSIRETCRAKGYGCGLLTLAAVR